MTQAVFLSLIVLFSSTGFARWDGSILSPKKAQMVKLNQIVGEIKPGQVVFIGEQHDLPAHHAHQKEWLQSLAAVVPPQTAISVGMEFFESPDQDLVDLFLAGDLTEASFLKEIKWGSNNFDFYREQVLFPKTHHGKTYALNLPRTIAHRIGQVGVAGLSKAERDFLPTDFAVGNEKYRERFFESMGGNHSGMPPAKMQNFFESQSAWDEAMASQIIKAMNENPNQILLVIVGNFHVEYYGGLPERLAARGFKNFVNIPQVNAASYTGSELKDLIISPHYGILGDLIWTSGEPQAQ